MEIDGLWLSRHPDVYEPSDDTFLLASAVADEVQPGDRFLEVGCGAGLVALTAARAGAHVVAVDVNPHAALLTRHHARQNRLAVQVIQGDLLSALRGPFDVVAFNPPYLPTSDDEHVSGPLDAAFDGGPDGNQVALRFAEQVLTVPLPRAILMVHSSLADPAPVTARLDERYRCDVVRSQKHFFEEVQVRRFLRR